MDDPLSEAYTLECGLIATWVGQDGELMPQRDIMLPVRASRKVAEILRKEFARRSESQMSDGEHKLFAQGLWCQLYAPHDYADLDVATGVQRLVASLVASRAQGSVYGGLTQSLKDVDAATLSNSSAGLTSAVRIIPIGLLGTARELIRIQQGQTSTLVFSAVGSILRRALKVEDGVSFMCLPRFFFGEELMKTALFLEDLFSSDDEVDGFVDRMGGAMAYIPSDTDPVFV